MVCLMGICVRARLCACACMLIRVNANFGAHIYVIRNLICIHSVYAEVWTIHLKKKISCVRTMWAFVFFCYLGVVFFRWIFYARGYLLNQVFTILSRMNFERRHRRCCRHGTPFPRTSISCWCDEFMQCLSKQTIYALIDFNQKN